MISPPTLTTDRLRLRAHTINDFESSFIMWSDPEVVKFIGGKISTRSQVWSRIMVYLGHWSLLHFGYWLVEDKVTGEFVGEVGISDFRRDITPSIEGIPEFGWALVPKYHGKGYASESITAILQWIEENSISRQLACIINPENVASIRLAKKFGFIESTQTKYLGEPVTLYFRNSL